MTPYTPPEVAWIGYLGILTTMAYSAGTVLIRAWMEHVGKWDRR